MHIGDIFLNFLVFYMLVMMVCLGFSTVVTVNTIFFKIRHIKHVTKDQK